MAEEVKEEVVEEEQHEEPKKKGIFGKVKSAILPDAEEQAAIISTFVRITVLAWSGGILTLNYVAIPNFPQKNIDPTFIASVFTGVLATFGVQTAKSKSNGNGGSNGGVSKGDLEKLIEKASQTAPAQVIRIEQAPLNLTASAPTPKKEEPPFKM